jgi:hypothetical protein
MTFEQQVRQELASTPFADKERRGILKVVLGEIQRIPPTMKTTDEAGFKVVKDMLKANEGLMEHLTSDNARYQALARENEILRPLLPSYWSEDQICTFLLKEQVDVKSAKGEGQAVGMAMKALKAAGAPVEGETVKKVVVALRQDEIADSPAAASILGR